MQIFQTLPFWGHSWKQFDTRDIVNLYTQNLFTVPSHLVGIGLAAVPGFNVGKMSNVSHILASIWSVFFHHGELAHVCIF